MDQEDLLNKLNKETRNLLLNTEKECRSLHAGTIEYSPTLSKAGLQW